MDGFYQAILDRDELQRLQDQICTVAGVYAFCVDHAGIDMTDMSGNEWDRENLERCVPKEDLLTLFQRISESSLEDQAIEETEIDALKYAAVGVKEDGRTVMAWLVYGVLSDADSLEGREFAKNFQYQTTESRFNLALDLLREISRHIVGDRIQAENARAESHQDRSSKEEMEYRLKKEEATTQIVQMSNREEPLEKVLENMLAVIGGFLRIDHAYLCSVGNGDDMSVLAEWSSEEDSSDSSQKEKRLRPGFLCREKPLVFSLDSGKEGYGTELEQAGIKALAAFPILWDDRVNMYVCFEISHRTHNWEVEEIRFLSDSAKLLQHFLTKRRQQDSLTGSSAVLEEILYNVGCSVYVKEQGSDRLLFVNKCLQNKFPTSEEQKELADILECKISNNAEPGSMEIYIEELGSWYDLFYKDITWMDGRPARMYSIYDITEQKMSQQKMERQAYTDFLTGLGNRLCCERDLAKCVAEAKKAGQKGAMLYLDLDDFKHINDSLSHQYGDSLLKSIANGMRKVQGIRNSCYRMGGDEFVILVPPDRYEMLDSIVEEIKAVFNRPWFLKDAGYYCTMSMGIVHFPSEGEEILELVKKADIAMYEAKKSGKNRVAVYHAGMKTESGKRLELEKKMRDAAMDGCKEFEVYYQPIVDMQNHNACIGAEALIRWNSEEMGFMSPVEFIPLAEYLGLINPIGSHVLQQACVECKRWNDNGHPEYKVHVNLSVVQLQQPDIVKTITKIIKKTKINPRNLTLEVTEGLAINDLERMKKILMRIKKLGVEIALDDFGTGYSSLNHVRELPVDVIKVDQSFVKDLAEDSYSKSFVKMVADLAEALGAVVCVEGIETEEQYKVLQGMKVKLIQGYYFGKPMPGDEFERKVWS